MCAPQCEGKNCGDDTCGGVCGTCGAGEVCNAGGVCECAPDCTGKVCGDDGCGGSCGDCAVNESCDAGGQCQWVPDCTGAVCGSEPLVSALRDFRGVLGGILDAHSAYLLIRGLKTLALRVQQQNTTALAVARYLEAHPEIERVWHPGLESHPDHAVAQRLMRGFGGVISFTVKGGLDRTSQVIDRCTLPVIAPSLGGVESLIEQPALMSYYELSTEERLKIGIRDNLVRLSVGVEDTADLIADLDQALEAS